MLESLTSNEIGKLARPIQLKSSLLVAAVKSSFEPTSPQTVVDSSKSNVAQACVTTPGPSVNYNDLPKDDTMHLNGQSLSVVYDPPHLIKGVRNNFLTKNIIMDVEVARLGGRVPHGLPPRASSPAAQAQRRAHTPGQNQENEGEKLCACFQSNHGSSFILHSFIFALRGRHACERYAVQNGRAGGLPR
ncbi:uncharacterized protein LOC125227040 [Leguminivora glycinivorella]|uniref:uncharacterized protein LOC125227040 n=1 Tax=Leguminivora glycinivorella TaxID=1035111 RepID=UPI0020109862|nr:uncharacterized protein LOC125227040 [Leguminivora glycinivorella]